MSLPPPLPANERERLQALRRYEVLDTLPEEAFDRIVRLAARMLRVPVAIINFVDEDRQWGKATHGTGSTEAPREHSFCAWTILSDEVMVVENAHEDPRFRDNPQVTGAPHIHLYAGAPLVTPGGYRLGSLCVVSPGPHEIREEDRTVLRELAAMVVDELEFRRARRDLEREVAVRERALRDLTENRAHTETLAVLLASLEVDLLPVEAARLTAEHVARQVGLDWVALASAGGNRVTARTVWHAPGVPDALLHTARQGVPLPGSLTGRTLERGAPLFVDESAQGPFADLGVRAAAALPLGRMGDVAHVYLAARLRPVGWSAADRQLLEAAASSVRVAFERAERAASFPG
ncbi:GAF domain-containing protein [Deinococcus aetherius]|uniref:GAF domain-containing protein n=1 Tax=Deinococcus aetherius TaxID=200252 RepID=UPI0022313A35|nr:GAF domain-containing protein [Deinococcus aetherius]